MITEWKKIESAPRDGRLIRLAWNPGDWSTGEGFWREDRWVVGGYFQNQHLPFPHMGIREVYPKNPVFWMERPEPPTDEESSVE